MKTTFLLILWMALAIFSLAQAPQGINYQAVIRGTDGEPIANQSVSLKISLQNEAGNTIHYSETHSVTTSAVGVVSAVVGNGSVINGLFSDVPWSQGNIFIKLEVDPNGGGYVNLGTSPIQSVPYALYAQTAKELVGNITGGDEEPIFVVKNSKDEIVFAVYESGVHMYVDDTSKGSRGGFAIGGLSDQTKMPIGKFMFVGRDSARIYIDESAKGSRGGFAIGGLSDASKSTSSNFLFLTPENYFIGHEAGKSNTDGLFNSFIGYRAGYSNTIGNRNTFIGYQSGYTNVSGINNVFIGNNTGYSNTWGFKNVFIGDSTGYSNSSGRFNIFIGDRVGYANTEGLTNVIIGATAGENNTTGSGNTFVGNWTGNHNVDGSGNVYIGNKAGWHNISGMNNIYIGRSAGLNELGSNKLFIENSEADSTEALIWGDFVRQKLRVNGMLGINKHPEYSTLEVYYGNGSSNLTIQGTGTNSAYSYSRLILMSKEEELNKRWDIMHTKSNELAISYHNGVEWQNDFEFRNNGVFKITSGSIGINISEEPTQVIDMEGNARFRMVGSSELGNLPLYITTEGVLSTAASDFKLKTNISTITSALSAISSLRGVRFSWLKDENATPKVGFIAQEVEKVLPEVVFTNPTDSLKGVNYAEITTVLVETIKEQQLQIQKLEEKLKDYESLKAEILTIKAILKY